MSAWIGEHGLTLGQVRTEAKRNEIKVVPKVLECLDVRGNVITADAMSCQREITQKIREQEADYVLAVKEKAKGLYEDIKDYFEGRKRRDAGGLSGGKSGRKRGKRQCKPTGSTSGSVIFLRKMANKRVGVKHRMMRTALNSDFLYEALFSA